jgi:hypothetical protein
MNNYNMTVESDDKISDAEFVSIFGRTREEHDKLLCENECRIISIQYHAR